MPGLRVHALLNLPLALLLDQIFNSACNVNAMIAPCRHLLSDECETPEGYHDLQAPKFYPADDVKTPLKRRVIRRPTALRSSIQPGTVLILLAGRFKGKRVVFLKQLPSGLLLITGPFKVNGVRCRLFLRLASIVMILPTSPYCLQTRASALVTLNSCPFVKYDHHLPLS